jgi:hypothetical protein
VGEYPLATGKPAFFFEKKDHWPWSPIGEIANQANVHVNSFKEFEQAFASALVNGLPNLDSEIQQLRIAAQPFPGRAAEKIVEVVIHDFVSGTPLVDKTQITELAWENRPTSEPLWD